MKTMTLAGKLLVAAALGYGAMMGQAGCLVGSAHAGSSGSGGDGGGGSGGGSSAPLVVDVPCGMVALPEGLTVYGARPTFPGKTDTDLALVHAMALRADPAKVPSASTPWTVVNPFVGNGAVLVICDEQPLNKFSSVRFVLPQ